MLPKIQTTGFNVVSDFSDIRLLVIKAANLPSLLASQGSVENVIGQIKSDPRVESVEPNRIAKIAGQTLSTGIDRTDADLSALAIGKGGNKIINADIADY